jgi:hypothetical protein
MQDVQMGKIISILNLDKIDSLVKDLRQKFRPMVIEYYRADLPVSLLLGGPANAKRVVREKANYVQIFHKNRKVLEFYGKDIRGNGIIWEENLEPVEYRRVLEILARNNFYTFRTWKEKNKGLRAFMMIMGVINLSLGLLLAPYYLFFSMACILFGLFLIALYIK